MTTLTTTPRRGKARPVGRVQIWAWKCERCGHVWPPRGDDKEKPPVTCPKCKNPYWNQPRKAKATKKAKGAS
jgi:predicted Zn-ribbon and HTH transcriptional regulator